jgi:ATP-dependent helicase/nuclease subunit B
MALKGEVIHEALSRFTLRHPAALPPDVAAELMAIADQVMRDLAAHPRIAAFWRPRLARFASWFAETEPGRRDGTVGIVSEIKGRLLLAPPGGPFVLTARADRIDLRADGGIVVTDYKSGQFPNLRSVVEGRSPQLPLEAAIAAAGGFPEIGPRPVAALRYVRASGGEPPGDEAIVDYADLAGLAQQALDGLLSLIATFDRPETPYRAVRRPTFADRYRFDDYAHLARVREWAAGEEGT